MRAMSKCLVLLFVFNLVHFLGAARLVLDIGKTVPIVHPDNAFPAELTACRELSEYLAKLTGGIYPIKSETEYGRASGSAIYVGDTAFARQQGIDSNKLEREEWVLRSVGNALILAGGKPRGTYYAVLEFLEQQGVVWPDELTEYVPPQKGIIVKDLNLRGKPGITYRRITLGLSPNATTLRFLAHNRFNYKNIPQEFGGGDEMGGCHTFHDFTSPDWPDEYFSLNGGKRTRSVNGGGPGQLCMTNKKMQEIVLKKMLEKIAGDRAKLPRDQWPQIYDLSQHDNDAYCQCENCMAVAKREGAYSGVLLEFINFVAKGVAEKYPDVLIQTFAYSHSQKPPKHIRPEPNVLIRLCKLGLECYPGGKCDTLVSVNHPRNKEYLEDFNKWHAISKQMAIWDYWVLYSNNSFPYVNVQAIAEDIAFYHANGVNNMLVECENAEQISFAAFKQWIGYRLMVHPELNLRAETERFFTAYFGPAAAPMLEYYDYLVARMNQADASLVQTGALSVPYLDRPFFEKSNELLDRAEELAAGNPGVLRRIGFERIPVDNSLLNMRSLFTDGLPAGKLKTLEEIYDRLRTNTIAHAAYYYHDGKAAAPRGWNYNPIVKAIDAKKNAYFAQKQNIPAEFTGRKVVDLNWSYGNINLLVDAKDALWGRAIRHPDGPNYHKLPFTMGIFERFKNRQIAKVTLEKKDIPQDEAFHLYSLGKYELKPGCQLWMNWTWLISMMVDAAYLPDGNNSYEVYVSLKFTGEPYVKGSKSQPNIFFERVLLVQ